MEKADTAALLIRKIFISNVNAFQFLKCLTNTLRDKFKILIIFGKGRNVVGEQGWKVSIVYAFLFYLKNMTAL